MKILKQTVLFCLGGGAYVGLELCFRGYSHGSMFLAGGLCFLLIGCLRDLPLPLGAVAGMAVITAVELTTGLLVNRDFSVWDYRGQPGNFLGQICPLFSAIWIPVTAVALLLHRWAGPRVEAALSRVSLLFTGFFG